MDNLDLDDRLEAEWAAISQDEIDQWEFAHHSDVMDRQRAAAAAVASAERDAAAEGQCKDLLWEGMLPEAERHDKKGPPVNPDIIADMHNSERRHARREKAFHDKDL